jgi:AcrR family transcriptional regulator
VTTPVERPLRRDASRNRERLLEAARELFAARGLEVPMDEIARHAGVGVGTAYRRFANRDELIDALFEDRMLAYVALAEEALGDPDPWDALVAFLERSLAMQAADRGLKELLFTHADARDRLTRMRARVMPLLEQVLRRAQDAGALRPDVSVGDVPMLSLMLGHVVDFAGTAEPELWRRYLALLLDGLRAGGRPLPGCALTPERLDAAMGAWRPRRRG